MIGSGNRISHIFGNIHAEGFKWNRMKQFLDLLSHGWSLPDSRGQGKRAGKVFTVQEKLISSVGGMSHAGAGEVGRHGGRPSRGGGGRCAVGADFSVFRGSRCRLGGGFFAADLRRWAQIFLPQRHREGWGMVRDFPLWEPTHASCGTSGILAGCPDDKEGRSPGIPCLGFSLWWIPLGRGTRSKNIISIAKVMSHYRGDAGKGIQPVAHVRADFCMAGHCCRESRILPRCFTRRGSTPLHHSL